MQFQRSRTDQVQDSQRDVSFAELEADQSLLVSPVGPEIGIRKHRPRCIAVQDSKPGKCSSVCETQLTMLRMANQFECVSCSCPVTCHRRPFMLHTREPKGSGEAERNTVNCSRECWGSKLAALLPFTCDLLQVYLVACVEDCILQGSRSCRYQRQGSYLSAGRQIGSALQTPFCAGCLQFSS